MLEGKWGFFLLFLAVFTVLVFGGIFINQWLEQRDLTMILEDCEETVVSAKLMKTNVDLLVLEDSKKWQPVQQLLSETIKELDLTIDFAKKKDFVNTRKHYASSLNLLESLVLYLKLQGAGQSSSPEVF